MPDVPRKTSTCYDFVNLLRLNQLTSIYVDYVCVCVCMFIYVYIYIYIYIHIYISLSDNAEPYIILNIIIVQCSISQYRIGCYGIVQSILVQYSIRTFLDIASRVIKCTGQGTRRKLVPPRHGESWSWLSCICVGSNVSQTLLGSSHCTGFFKPLDSGMALVGCSTVGQG